MKKILIMGIMAVSVISKGESKLGEYQMWKDIEIRAEKKDEAHLSRGRRKASPVKSVEDRERGHGNKSSGGAY